jgi:hypothetical protein
MLRSIGPRDASILENCKRTTGGTVVPPCVGSSYEMRCKYRDVGDGQPNG